MKQTIISVIGPSGCGKSQYINPIVRQLINNGYTVHAPSLIESKLSRYLESVDSDAQFVILHVGSNSRNNPNMRIEFHDWDGPMDLIEALHEKRTSAPPTDEELDAIQTEDACAAARAHAYSCAKAEAEAALAQLSMDDDLDEPLGQACNRDNPECESCT